MTFTFNTAIPAANNNPSVDQPDMLINNQSTDGIINVDHISFNAMNGGQHKQVTFNNVAAPGAQINPQSILYTVAGVASTNSDMRFRNQNGIFPVNLIRAYAVSDTAGNIVAGQSINVTSITKTGPGTSYTVVMPANVVTGTTNYAIFSEASDFNIIFNATPSNATTFVIRSITNSGVNQYPGGNFRFIVLQI